MTTRSEKFEILIEATPEDVWRCLTTKQGLEAWFGTKAEIELEIGGTRTIAWGDAMEMTGELHESGGAT